MVILPENNTVYLGSATGSGSGGGSVDESKIIVKSDTIPAASADNTGYIYIYTGSTNATYTHGYIYENKKTATYDATVSFTAASISGTTVACGGEDFAAFALEAVGADPTAITSGTMTYDSESNLWVFVGKDANNQTVATYQVYQEDYEAAGFTFTGTPSDGDVVSFTCTIEEDTSSYQWVRVNVQPEGDTLPAQSGQSGKFLTTDGTNTSWSSIPAPEGVYTEDNLVGGRNISLGATTYEKNVELDNDTVALFHFNGNYADSSNYAASGNYYQSSFSPRYANGKFGYSLSTTNINGNGSIGYKNDGFTSTDVFTLDWCVYIYANENNAGYQTVYLDNQYSKYIRLKAFSSSNTIRIYSDSNSGVIYDNTCSALEANKWNHIAMQVKSGTSCDIFINGTLFTTITTNIPTFDRIEQWRIDTMASGAYLDEIRLSKVVRYEITGYTVPAVPYGKEAVSATGIDSDLYAGNHLAEKEELDDDTRLLLHFDDPTNVLKDYSKYNIPLQTITGVDTATSGYNVGAGRFGNSVQFSGMYAKTYKSLDFNTIFSKKELTLDYWAWYKYPTSSGTVSCAKFEFGGDSVYGQNNVKIGTLYGATNKLYVAYDNGGLFSGLQNTSGYDISALNIQEGDWYHVAITIQNTVAKLYVNGHLITTKTASWPSNDLYRFSIHYSGSSPVPYIDEVRVSSCIRWDSDFAVPTAPYKGENKVLIDNNGDVFTSDTIIVDKYLDYNSNYSEKNYKIVGDLELKNDKGSLAASGFSDSNYIIAPDYINQVGITGGSGTITSFEIRTAISVDEAVDQNYGILDCFCDDSRYHSAGYRLTTSQTGTLRFRLMTSSSSYNIDLTGTTVLLPNVKYYVKVTYSNSTGYALYSSLDNSTWTTEATSSTTSEMAANQSRYWMYVGRNVSSGYPLPGKIWLGDTKSLVNGTQVWAAYDIVSGQTNTSKSMKNLSIDTKEVSVLSMPSISGSSLTLGESGDSYTAASTGWVYVSKTASAAGQYLAIVKSYGTSSTYEAAVMWSAGAEDLYVMAPVRKGESFKINYSTGGATKRFLFIAAEGDK